MKRYIYLLLLLCLSVSIDAQNRTEPQKFLNEIKIRRKPHIYRDISSSRDYYINNYSEVWLRILEDGRFRVEVGGQIMENSTGLYRFFDLSRGRSILSIYENNRLIYRTPLELRKNTRLMLDFDGYALYLYDEVDLNSYNYEAFPNVLGDRYMRAMNDREFEEFFGSYSSKSFDSDKLAVFHIRAKNAYFTSEQIAKMIKVLSFDNNQLELAKVAYDYCIDPEKYYQVVDVIKFKSTRSQLEDYILKKR